MPSQDFRFTLKRYYRYFYYNYSLSDFRTNLGLCTPPTSSFTLLPPSPPHRLKRKRKRRMDSYRLFIPHPPPPPSIMQVHLCTSVGQKEPLYVENIDNSLLINHFSIFSFLIFLSHSVNARISIWAFDI